jgi:hypothetical protein
MTGLLLEGGTIADAGFSGQPLTREGVDMLIDYLKLLRRGIPQQPKPSAPTEGTGQLPNEVREHDAGSGPE